MIQPSINLTISENTQNITLCFDDGIDVYYENEITGFYVIADTLYNNRAYWYQPTNSLSNSTMNQPNGYTYYLFYDEATRYWIINNELGDTSTFTSPEYNVYCLKWDESEPFNCDTWYFYSSSLNISQTQTMTTNCTLPTSAPTSDPTDFPTWYPTNDPTTIPSSQPTDIPSTNPTTVVIPPGEEKSGTEEGASDNSLIYLIVAGVILCCCILLVFLFCIKKSGNRAAKADNRMGGLASQQDLGATDAMVQLGPLKTTTDTGFGNGERLDAQLEDSDIVDNGDNDDDPLDGDDMVTKGGPDDDNIVPEDQPLNWEKFDSEDGLIANTSDVMDGDPNVTMIQTSPEINPFDDDDNRRKQTVGTIGGDDGMNPFLADHDDDEDNLGLPGTMEQRDNWVAFDE